MLDATQELSTKRSIAMSRNSEDQRAAVAASLFRFYIDFERHNDNAKNRSSQPARKDPAASR